MKVIKVLKDGMTLGELRNADLTDVSNVEKELIDIILSFADDDNGFYAYEDEDEDDSIIFFEADGVLEIGRRFGDFYFNRFDNWEREMKRVPGFYNQNGAIEVTLQDVVDAIEKAGDGETIDASDFWEDYHDDEVKAAEVLLSFFQLGCSYDDTYFTVRGGDVKILENFDDLEDIEEGNLWGSCKYKGEEYYFVTDDIDSYNEFYWVGLIKKELVNMDMMRSEFKNGGIHY